MANAHPKTPGSFGEILRHHRYAVGLSQEHLAERSGLSATGIGALERGLRKVPRPETIALLVAALGLSDEQSAVLRAAAHRVKIEAGRVRSDAVPAATLPHAVLETSEASSDEAMDNLPIASTTFVGRERDVAHLRSLLVGESNRLVTITGVGGVGKSRLALEIVQAIRGNFAQGVWLVELGSISDAGHVASAVASVLGVSERGDRTLTETLQRALKSRSLLLILDNCEHVLASAAELAAGLIRACPQVRIIATSRELLRIAAERTYALAPLPYPMEAQQSSEAAMSFPAVQLFVCRALEQTANSFEMRKDDVPYVVEIARRLDGLPLAIELAVASLRTLNVPELARKLGDRFAFLGAGDRTAPFRHQTLRGLIDWSYDRLTADERFVFQSCSTFSGAFTIDAMTDVCARDDLSEGQLFHLLSALVDKSLIIAQGKSERRYAMLDSIREYSQELVNDADVANALSRKHANHYLNVARQVLTARSRTLYADVIVRLRQDRANFETALVWTLLEHHDPELGGELASLLMDLFESESLSRARRWFDEALAALDSSAAPILVATLTLRLEQLLRYQPITRDRLVGIQRAVAVFRGSDDIQKTCLALSMYALALAASGSSDAAGAAAEAVLLAKAALTPIQISWTLRVHALVLLRDNLELQTALLNEAVQVTQFLVPGEDASFTLIQLGEVQFFRDEIPLALESTNRAIEILQQAPSIAKPDLALGFAKLSVYLLAHGNADAARSSAREALKISIDLGDSFQTALVVRFFALSSAIRGNFGRAALLSSYCDARTGPINPIMHLEFYSQTRLAELLSAAVPDADLAVLRSAGAEWSEQVALDQALLV